MNVAKKDLVSSISCVDKEGNSDIFVIVRAWQLNARYRRRDVVMYNIRTGPKVSIDTYNSLVSEGKKRNLEKYWIVTIVHP